MPKQPIKNNPSEQLAGRARRHAGQATTTLAKPAHVNRGLGLGGPAGAGPHISAAQPNNNLVRERDGQGVGSRSGGQGRGWARGRDEFGTERGRRNRVERGLQGNRAGQGRRGAPIGATIWEWELEYRTKQSRGARENETGTRAGGEGGVTRATSQHPEAYKIGTR